MAKHTSIQWTDATWNPWVGCRKISSGCRACYMFRDMERYGQDPLDVRRTKDKTFYAPLTWKDARMVFTCSWSDFFIPQADKWRGDAWQIIHKCPQHQWQILTKRPERIHNHLPSDWLVNAEGEPQDYGYPNVWLGTSVENQKTVHRMTTLLQVPAAIRWISAEPLLGPIQFDLELLSLLDWMVIGGESGTSAGQYRYRSCRLEWLTSIINQCQAVDTPVFVKQLGTGLAKQLQMKDKHGGDIQEFPEALQVREYPQLIKTPELFAPSSSAQMKLW